MAQSDQSEEMPVASTSRNTDGDPETNYFCRFCGEHKNKYELIDIRKNEVLLKNTILRLQYLHKTFDFNQNIPIKSCRTCFNEFNGAFEFMQKFNGAQTNLRNVFPIEEGPNNELSNLNNNNELAHIYEKRTSVGRGVKLQTFGNKHILKMNCILPHPNIPGVTTPRKVHIVVEAEFKVRDAPAINDTEETTTISDGVSGDVQRSIMAQVQSESLFTEVVHPVTRILADGLPIASNESDIRREVTITSQRATITHEQVISYPRAPPPILRDPELVNAETSQVVVKTEPPEIKTEPDDEFNDSDNEPLASTSADPIPYIPEEPVQITRTLRNRSIVVVPKHEPSTSVKRKADFYDDEPPFMRTKTEVDMDKSWNSYTWTCCHCDEQFNNLRDLRVHSKAEHRICFGFECPECDAEHYRFEEFVHHVRGHWKNLRYYCHFCNKKFKRISQCTSHAATHFANQPMCHHCGEILADRNVLNLHSSIYKKHTLVSEMAEPPRVIVVAEMNQPLQTERLEPSTWDDYTWACNWCDDSFSNAQELRDHSVAVHNKCYGMKCADCDLKTNNFMNFTAHVWGHRPYLKNYCPFCNACIDFCEFKDHILTHLGSDCHACGNCGQMFQNDQDLNEHFQRNQINHEYINDAVEILTQKFHNTHDPTEIYQEFEPCDEDQAKNSLQAQFKCNTCKKFFKSDRSYNFHVRLVTCKMCNKVYNCHLKLKGHLFSVHMAKKPFECFKCGRCFLYCGTIREHMQEHANDEMVTCNVCGASVTKSFYNRHIKIHDGQTISKEIYCKICFMRFESITNMVSHVKNIHHKMLLKPKVITAYIVKPERSA